MGTKIVETVVLTEFVYEYFQSEIVGLASSMAFTELLINSNQYLLGEMSKPAYTAFLEFCFGIEPEEFEKIELNANKKWVEELSAFMGEEI